jgi:hypothetical protein
LEHCGTCDQNASANTRAPLQSIISNNLWERVQIDLIDFTNQPDGEWNWILHIVDHWSKFNAAYAMKSKQSKEVAYWLAHFMSLFGPSQILQCDNGTEFKGACSALLQEHGILIINGRP